MQSAIHMIGKYHALAITERVKAFGDPQIKSTSQSTGFKTYRKLNGIKHPSPPPGRSTNF